MPAKRGNRVTFATVDDYIHAQPAAVQPILSRVRDCIREAVPEAEESISYRMPAYRIDERPVVYFAGWKKHYSIYPVGAAIGAVLKDELAPYEIEQSTVRFPFAGTVPASLIGRIARLRAIEVAGVRAEPAGD